MLACNTIKQGKECVFMKKNGCAYNGGNCHPIVDNCDNCNHIEIFSEGNYCKVYAEPALKWNAGFCNMATNNNGNANEKEEKSQKINPLKASKRSMR